MTPKMTKIDYFKLLVSILVWIPKAFLIVCLKLLTVILSPILALKWFVRWEEESDVTGYPSLFPGKKMAFLIKPLMGFQTQDDTLDHYWYSNKADWLRDKGYTQDYYNNHEWIRWYTRMLWLCRNPAYQFADWLGWDNKEITVLKKRDEDRLWASGANNFSYWIVKNQKGQVTFNISGQYYYYKNWYVEFEWGYAFFRWEPDDRCMLNVKFNPWRRFAM